jgi:hypothetical protein
MRRIFAATLSDAHRSPATEAMIGVVSAVSERFRGVSAAAAA